MRLQSQFDLFISFVILLKDRHTFDKSEIFIIIPYIGTTNIRRKHKYISNKNVLDSQYYIIKYSGLYFYETEFSKF